MAHRQKDIDRLLIICSCLIFLLGILVAVLVPTEPERLVRARDQQMAREIELGAALYDQHCRSCHGIRGEGVGQLGPPLFDDQLFNKRLAEVGWNSTLRAYIISSTELGRMMGTRPIYAGNGSTAVMPAWLDRHGGPLRADQISSLVDYIENWERTALGKVTLIEIKLPASSKSDPKTLARGKDVYLRTCGKCHAFQDIASPTVPGPALDNVSHRTFESNEPGTLEQFIHDSILIPELEVTKSYRQLSDTHPCGATLTLTELNDVTAFLLQ